MTTKPKKYRAMMLLIALSLSLILSASFVSSESIGTNDCAGDDTICDRSTETTAGIRWVVGDKSVESCVDDCLYQGQKICDADDGGFRECDYYDADSCLDWRHYSCGSDEACDTGICKKIGADSCDYSGQRECTNDGGYRICGDYDSDGYLGWQYHDCGPYETCSEGYCDNSCHDECDDYGERECTDNDKYRVCGYYDTDTCLDWKYYDCDGGEECSRGYCKEDCDSGYEREYHCEGNWLKRLYVYDDCDEDWRNYEYCEYGCRNDECLDPWGNNYEPPGYGYPSCTTYNNNCNTCPTVNYCGDGNCNSLTESCSTCPQDCGTCQPQIYCGDNLCNNGESCSTCPQDCGTCQPQIYCGDGACNGEESCSNCPTDCGECNHCGDGICSEGESCTNCLSDCGECVTPKVVEQNELCTETNECTIPIEEPDTGSDVVSNNTPSGAFILGELDWFSTAIWFLAIVNIVLFVIIVGKKLRS